MKMPSTWLLFKDWFNVTDCQLKAETSNIYLVVYTSKFSLVASGRYCSILFLPNMEYPQITFQAI